MSAVIPATPRGVAYSCEAAMELELAARVADDDEISLAAKVADDADSAVTYYSVGILADQEDLAARAVELLGSRGLRLTYHPIDMDLGGNDPLDDLTVKRMRQRAEELDAPWVTVDLAQWVKRGEPLINNLVPMPLIREAVDWVVPRIQRLQDEIGRPLAVENAPYPFMVGDCDILQLMTEIVDRAGCLATLDIGHLYGLRRQQHSELVKPSDADFCWDRVVEVHIAGNFDRTLPSGEFLFEDYHTYRVSPQVWELAEELVPRAAGVRALMAECEYMPHDDLVASINQISAAVHRWFGTEPGQGGQR
ncbi:DUF692 family multinuclear iron-containing protein [Streptomyces sp. NPDC059373]